MFKRILVPTDGSESSRHALMKALELASKFDSEIELFHVTPSQEAYYGFNESYNTFANADQIKSNGDLALANTLKGLNIEGVHLSKKHVSGSASVRILDEIKRDFDLVIMGTRGHSGIVGAVLGSVAQRVLASSDCPVLIVK
ncbi:universal stress protein [Desulfosporosinus fructosivorans]|uniref:Universal stress protein n=1 Tax=Desulfosporosinus fructosivorans TaxID=2018669 RepID=A0A4Z0R8H6_9FIRM|nr:universal stress protein [Desulfosporosinus fructosivorans]TGE38453.1 universal stress protein [Desulfosporosinus fructosivorans]